MVESADPRCVGMKLVKEDIWDRRL